MCFEEYTKYEWRYTMKKLSLATAIFAASVTLITANANAYQAEVGASYDYTDFDHGSSADVIGVDGTYYFNPVSVKNSPYNEAAFLNSASNVKGSLKFSDDDIRARAAVEYFVPNSQFYLSGNLGYTNPDNSAANDIFKYGAEVGYLPMPGLLLAVGFAGQDVEGQDNDIDPSLRAKYVTKVSGYDVNFEAGTTFGDVDVYNLGADIYLDPTLSLGVAYESNFDSVTDDIFSLRAKKFLNQQVSVEGSVGFGDDANEFGLRAAYRF